MKNNSNFNLARYESILISSIVFQNVVIGVGERIVLVCTVLTGLSTALLEALLTQAEFLCFFYVSDVCNLLK